VIGLFEGDEAGEAKALFSSKYVFLHDQLSTKAWASTKKGDEFTEDITNYVDSTLAILDSLGKKTYIYFNYVWFDANNISTFEQKISNQFNNAKDHVKEKTGDSDFNLLVVVNAKFDAALNDGLKSVSFREQFYPMNGLDSECTESVRAYLRSSTKKKFTDGLNEALIERANNLIEKIRDCKVEVPPEIIVHYKRKGKNKYRSWGEFTVLGTEFKGFILERPQGDNPTVRQSYKRHPSGTFNLIYSSSATGTKEKFWGVTLCLKEANGYKLHGGNRADNSDGCFLINYYSPKDDKYPEAYSAKEEDVNIDADDRRDNPDAYKYKLANAYYTHGSPENPARKLRDFVESLENSIKAKYKIDAVVKRFIIDEADEIIDP
jgi:hypothetical protein